MKSHGEGIRGRDHMYSSESFWRLCGNTCLKKPRGERGRQRKNNHPEKRRCSHSQASNSTDGKGRSLSKGMLTDLLWNVKDLFTVSGNAFNLEILRGQGCIFKSGGSLSGSLPHSLTLPPNMRSS